MNEQYFNEIRELVINKTGAEPEEIKPDSYFEDDLNLDHMEFIEILTDLEDKYQIELVESLESIETIQDLVDIMSEKLD